MSHPPKSEAQNAIHEAGHAVAGYAFRIPMLRVSIIPQPSEGNAGHTEFSPDFNPQDIFGRFDLFIKDFCGYAAEEKAGYEDLSGWLLTDKTNLELSMFVLIETGIVSRGDEIEFEQWLLRQARTFTEKNWTAIQKFAEALVEKRQMNGKEVEQLCETLEIQRRQPGSQIERWSLP